ncbi:MAG TPA: lamin tail domain-containing protein [Anaerolineae bacterium]|nr:lamin tail domain-containing protein [Anaerolineae bacterium]
MKSRRLVVRVGVALAVALLFALARPYVFLLARNSASDAPSSVMEPAAGSVAINELVATNRTGLKDEDGATSDWIELYNSSARPVSLAGWSLTDARYQPRMWVFPDITLEARSYLVVFASGKNRRPTDMVAPLHTNFKLGAEGEHLALYNASEPPQMIDGFSPRFPKLPADVSLGRSGRAGEWRFFSQPTPGEANDEVATIQLQSELRLAITAPKQGEVVSGLVKVKGYSDTRAFQKWQLDLLLDADPAQAVYLTHGTISAPVRTELYKLDTTRFPDGEHALRLRAVRSDGNYDEYTLMFTIANSTTR